MKYPDQLSSYFPSASGAEQCYRGDVQVPIHSRPVHSISALEAFQIALSASSKMCSRKPVAVQENALFVVDPKCLKSVEDLKADDNGVWLWTGKPRKWYKVEHYSDSNEPVSAKIVSSPCVPLKRHEKVYQLCRLYEQNQSTPEFHRILYFFRDGKGKALDVILLQYYFEGGKEVPVVVAPHGHSKSSRPFFRTQKSTLDRIRDTSQELKPREVVSKLFEEAGGSVGCTSASEEPRNRKQVYNACQLTDSKCKDPIFDLIEQLRHHKLLGSEAFVREVGFSNFPFCNGALEKQLRALEKNPV